MLGLAVSVLSTVENTRQVTECVALHCNDKCKARIMAESIYDFLCLYGLKSGYDKHCGRKDNAADNECISSSCARGYQRH